MINISVKWRIIAAASLAAALLPACHDGGDNGGVAHPVAPQPTEFSAFAKQALAANANSTPVSLDGVKFNFDVNDDPAAFDALLMSGGF